MGDKLLQSKVTGLGGTKEKLTKGLGNLQNKVAKGLEKMDNNQNVGIKISLFSPYQKKKELAAIGAPAKGKEKDDNVYF